MQKWIDRQYRHAGLIVLGLVALTFPLMWYASGLVLKSDFKELLPQEQASVKALDEARLRFGNTDTLIIAIESPHPENTEKFIDDLAQRLNQLGPEWIHAVDANIRETQTYFEKRRFLYLDVEDLEEIDGRLERQITYEKLRQNPFFIDLEDSPPRFEIQDIEEKYAKRAKGEGGLKYQQYRNGYFFNEDASLAAVVVRPNAQRWGVGFTYELIQKVEAIVAELNPSRYGESLRVSMAGALAEAQKEYGQVIRDVTGTLGLCVLLVIGVLYLYFWRLSLIALLVIPVLQAVVVTFAITRWGIGFLTTQTAFLGSIIVGNGINTGVLLMGRYLEEKRKGHKSPEAMGTAVRSLIVGTAVSSVTTAVAYAALILTEVRGLSHFGFIGGLGAVVTWAMTLLTLPSWVFLVEKAFPRLTQVQPKRWEIHWDQALQPVSLRLQRQHKSVLAATSLAAMALVAALLQFYPDVMEYDFSKLRNKVAVSQGEDPKIYGRVNSIFRDGPPASVIPLKSSAQAQGLCQTVMGLEVDVPSQDRTIARCETLETFIPSQQDKKFAVLKRIDKRLKDPTLAAIHDKDLKQRIQSVREEISALRPITAQDLPAQIRRNFTELNGDVGRLAYVFPTRSSQKEDGRHLIRFANILSHVSLGDGGVVHVAGQSAIFADLLSTIQNNGPWVSMVAFLAVASVVGLIFRRWRPFVFVMSSLSLGVFMMLGLQALFRIKFNFFNFIAIPLVYGIGVDYAINLYQRFKLDGRDSLAQAVASTGSTILLCSLTTMVSYVTLLFAHNQALASFGYLALFGEIGCITAALIVTPAAYFFRRQLKSGPEQKDPEAPAYARETLRS